MTAPRHMSGPHSQPLWQQVPSSGKFIDAFTRHKQLMHFLQNPAQLEENPLPKSDLEELREHFRFLLPEIPDDRLDAKWQMRMVRAYHARLFKEYCICDLSYAESEYKIAMRWRTEPEVLSGKGQFECGNIYCSSHSDLSSWEVNFGYFEDGIKKNALIKLVLCPNCTKLLHISQAGSCH
jgi:protein FRA10AC1